MKQKRRTKVAGSRGVNVAQNTPRTLRHNQTIGARDGIC